MSYVGKLLIAPPAQDNEQWHKSMVFIYEQTANSVAGLILNKPSDRTLFELADFHGLTYDGDDNLYSGGTKNSKALVMLHSDDWSCSNTMQIKNGFRVSSDRTMLTRVFSGDAPSQWRMFVGMSLWSPAQLYNEIHSTVPSRKKTAWLPIDATADLVYALNPNQAWRSAIDLAAASAVQTFFSIS